VIKPTDVEKCPPFMETEVTLSHS